MDVLYVTGNDDPNDELRYSLRSLVNIPHNQVFICGYKPSWVQNVIHIPDPNDKSPQENSNSHLLKACLDERLSDDFLFMNDDFYIMKQMPWVPVFHQGLLVDRIDQYKSGHRMNQAYSLITTQLALDNPDALSYELHIPMMMNKQKVVDMFSNTNLKMIAIRPRTLYGNIYKVKGLEKEDVKGSQNQDEAFLSSGGDPGGFVRRSFPTPSPYENIS